MKEQCFMKRFHLSSPVSVLGPGLIFFLTWMSLMGVFQSLAWAQSGAPNLLQFHGRLVDPITGQLITTPTQIRIQIIHGGTAEENPSTGRVVFSEQTEMLPDEQGEFDYAIGSHAPGVGTGRARLDAEDFNTTQPVFVEIALVQPNGSVHVLLPRQRLSSVPYALQAEIAKDAAVDDRFVNVQGDTMTGPLTVAGLIESTQGGFQFPDGTIQTTAGLASVSHNATLTGNGTSGSPLGIANGGVGTQQLADSAVTAAKIAPGQVVKSLNGLFDNVTLAAGSNITITPSGNMLTITAPNALSSVAHNATLTGNGTSGMPLGVTVPLSLSGSVGGLNAIINATNSGIGFGVQGDSPGIGVVGTSTSGIGVKGESIGSGDLFLGESGGMVRFRVDNDGDVFAKSYTPPSDIRLKTNLQPLTDALDKLQQIRGVSFEWTNVNPSPAPREIGVIAQEVEPVFPELVKPWGDQGYKGVSYDGLTAVLVEGVKALKAENETLQARLDVLEQMVKELKAEVKKSRHQPGAF